ncbi:hypothetical protein [Streptomyces sp. NPDC056491]|uniref:hypothetical protein n=1 Tax=Streptomyces sp. NPDC056491 TaxID=3345837 RepID=UPI0036B8C5C9
MAFHNPSIEDYFRFHLAAGRARLPELLKALVRGEQLIRLVAAARMADGEGILTRMQEHKATVADFIRQMGEQVETG